MEMYKSKAAMAKHEKGEPATMKAKEKKSGMKNMVGNSKKKKGK